jgi:hypothetical protein
MTISLAFLAPNLVKAEVEGRLPRGIGVTVPIPVRQERNFRMQRQRRENHDQRRRKPEQNQNGSRPVAEIPAKSAYLDSTHKILVRKIWVIAFFIPRRLAICMAHALGQDHFFERSMLCAAS